MFKIAYYYTTGEFVKLKIYNLHVKSVFHRLNFICYNNRREGQKSKSTMGAVSVSGKWIVLQITDLLYIKYETQESMVIKSIYPTNYGMETTREGMSNTIGRMWESKYSMYIQQNNPKNNESREKEVWNPRTQTKNWPQNIQHQRPEREM